MPAISYAKRYWRFGSDDFVFSSIFDILLRIICARGGVMERSKRKPVPHVGATIVVFTALEIILSCVNLYFATVFKSSCKVVVKALFIAGNSLFLVHDVTTLIWLAIHIRSSSDYWSQYFANNNNVDVNTNERPLFLCPDSSCPTLQADAMEHMGQHVRRRMHRFSHIRPTSTQSTGAVEQITDDSAAIDSAAKMFSAVFYDVDLVPSDILAGIFLLRWQSHQWTSFGHSPPFSVVQDLSTTASFDPHDENQTGDNLQLLPDSHWLSISRLTRMAVMSTSIYGKLFYLYDKCGSVGGIEALYSHLSCLRSKKHPGCCLCGDQTDQEPYRVGCCLCAGHNMDFAAVLQTTGLKPDDFTSVHLENAIYRSPYFVAVDNATQTIVVAIRGTLSFEDAIVDLVCDGTHLEELEQFVLQQQGGGGEKPCFIGHRGFVSTARRLFQSIIAEGSIDKGLSKHPNYDLVVTGHSLGAGIASILTLLLKPMYPDVKGYAMSAPLGAMNPEMAEYAKSCLVSVVYGFDLFAHLNFRTMLDFKWRLVDALSATQLPKYKILGHGLHLSALQCCCPCCGGAGQGRRRGQGSKLGTDPWLLSHAAQQRLICPSAEVLFNGGGGGDTPAAATAASSGETGQSSVFASGDNHHDPSRSRRFYSGRRCIMRWLDPQMDANRFPWPNSVKSQCPDSGSSACDLDDGEFGGHVLHLVDVDLTDWRRGRQQSLTDSPSSRRALIGDADGSGGSSCSPGGCCGKQQRPLSVVGVWSRADQFKTLLVHPQMLSDHMPNRLVRAFNRWNDSIKAALVSGNVTEQGDTESSTDDEQLAMPSLNQLIRRVV